LRSSFYIKIFRLNMPHFLLSGTVIGLRRRALLLLLLVLLTGSARTWASTPPATGPRAMPAARAAGRPLAEALNPNGTLRAGLRGSFDPTGYALGTDAATGQSTFRSAAARGPRGVGDANWQDGFGLPGANGLGMNGVVYALVVDGNGNVYAGGDFTTAGGTTASRIAKWNGTAWSALGLGMNAIVLALAVDGNGNVYAGGNFTTAGSVVANYVAKWDGTAWSALGTGVNSQVQALAVDGNGNVYTGGNFTTAGGTMARSIAKWNGTAWSALGSGIAGGSFGGNLPVLALAVDGQGNLYAGGPFSAAGGVAVSFVAKWNGTAWSALGTGTSDVVYALAVDGNGNVYAGGSFTWAGGAAVNRIAKWDGTAWSALGPGVSFPPQLFASVRALAVDGSGQVYAGGEFVTAGSVAANYVAKWDGTAWSALGTGVNNYVRALAVRSGKVYVGGHFTTVGDGSKTTAHFGIYHPNGVLSTASAALAAQVALYPNPSGKALFVSLPAALRQQDVTAVVVDALGRVVFEQVLPPGEAPHVLSLTHVASGTYALRLHTGAGTVTKRLVVE
jgi:hypothetical protein